jgi:hypothetical protein
MGEDELDDFGLHDGDDGEFGFHSSTTFAPFGPRVKPAQSEYGHTPLPGEENIPWGGRQLVVGTGVHGQLPVMPEVEAEAKRRRVKLISLPTEQACKYLGSLKPTETYAVLHVTCSQLWGGLRLFNSPRVTAPVRANTPRIPRVVWD